MFKSMLSVQQGRDSSVLETKHPDGVVWGRSRAGGRGCSEGQGEEVAAVLVKAGKRKSRGSQIRK